MSVEGRTRVRWTLSASQCRFQHGDFGLCRDTAALREAARERFGDNCGNPLTSRRGSNDAGPGRPLSDEPGPKRHPNRRQSLEVGPRP